jgi:hypothetical protein
MTKTLVSIGIIHCLTNTLIDKTCYILKKLYLDSFFTKQQIRRGFDRIYIDEDSIREDVPDLPVRIAKTLVKLIQENVITNQVILKIPNDFREEMLAYEPFKEQFAEELKVFDDEPNIKKKFSDLCTFYLNSYDNRDIIDHLKNLGHSDIVIPWFIRKAIFVSCGKGNKDREMVSQLLKELSKELKWNYAVFSYAFDHCIEHCHDYTLDIPHFPDYVAMFIARAIYDECFNGMYILHAETYESEERDLQLKILKTACSYLSLYPMENHLENIWGSAISNQQIWENFAEIVQEFHNGGDSIEISLKLKDLDCHYFYYEFVKRLIILYVQDSPEEVDYDRILKFLNFLVVEQVLTKSQLEVGLKNAKHDLSKKLGKDEKVALNLKKFQEECLSKVKID